MVRPGLLRAGGTVLIAAAAFVVGASFTARMQEQGNMDLGNFSVSLSVKDLAASKQFYQHMGFSVIAGEEEESWLILKNGDAKIGIFQDKFEGNLLTFSPSDVRDIQRALKERGVSFMLEAEGEGSGPGHAVLQDPDGNVILLDQH